MTNQRARKPYPSDVTDAQWEILAPFIPEPASDSAREPIERRESVNCTADLLRTGCSWRQLPHDVPNGKTVSHSFRLWKRNGIWEKAMSVLRKQVRTQMGREEEPSAAIIESPSITTSPVRGTERGFDGGKKIFGRKRHLLVETQGVILAVLVHAATIGDRDGARLLLRTWSGASCACAICLPIMAPLGRSLLGSQSFLAGTLKSFLSLAMRRIRHGCWSMANLPFGFCPKVAFTSNIIVGGSSAHVAGSSVPVVWPAMTRACRRAVRLFSRLLRSDSL